MIATENEESVDLVGERMCLKPGQISTNGLGKEYCIEQKLWRLLKPGTEIKCGVLVTAEMPEEVGLQRTLVGLECRRNQEGWQCFFSNTLH